LSCNRRCPQRVCKAISPDEPLHSGDLTGAENRCERFESSSASFRPN
jgi:hypothetical protein